MAKPKAPTETTKNETASAQSSQTGTEGAGPMPEVRGGPVPYLQLRSAAEAAAFYQKAFGAEEVFRAPPDEQGRYMHIHLYVNGGSLMLCDPFPEHGYPLEKPQALTLHLEVADADAAWKRAVDAGANGTLPPHDSFWGARYAQLVDPFGVLWSFGSPVKA
jgi:PhnB protein